MYAPGHTGRRRRVTRAPLEGVSGPAGTYKNTPALGQAGAIAGDPDWSVLFRQGQSEYALIPVEQEALTARNALTLEAWVQPVSYPTDATIIEGPYNDAAANTIWHLSVLSSGDPFCLIEFRYGNDALLLGTTAPLPLNVWSHVCVTFDGTTARMYMNGIQVDTDTPAGTQIIRTSDQTNPKSTSAETPGRLLLRRVHRRGRHLRRRSHSRPGARPLRSRHVGVHGPQHGGADWDVLTLVGEWDEWNVDPGDRLMTERRYAGLAPSELIAEAVEAEGNPAAFFFDARGVPTFLPSSYRTDVGYLQSSYTFTSTEPIPE